MGISDALSVVKEGKKEKKTAEKRYVAFSTEEWTSMETAYGSRLEPVDVKRLIQGIFNGQFTISVSKAAAKVAVSA